MVGSNSDDSVRTRGGPAHLLELVHALVDQRVCQTFGRCCSDRLSLTMAQTVIHQVCALPIDVVAEFSHRGAQSFGR